MLNINNQKGERETVAREQQQNRTTAGDTGQRRDSFQRQALRVDVLINDTLDGIAGPHYYFAGIEISPYVGLGVCGIAAGLALIFALGLRFSISVAVLIGFSIIAVGTFVLLGLARKAILKNDRHVLIEDLIVVLGVAGLFAWVLNHPVRLTLDVLTLGLGVFLVFGRLGCLACGCCHGRPAKIGIRYHPGAIDDLMAGIRLFPVQLVESAWIALITVTGISLILSNVPPGTSFWFWIISYGAGRFVFEFARGDLRRYFGPLSEAQWIFLAVLTAKVIHESVFESFDPKPLLIHAAAAALALIAYLTRHWWLATMVPAMSLSEIPAWQVFLASLERNARLRDLHRKSAGVAPGDDVSVELAIGPADNDLELHCYSLRGSSAPLGSRRAFAIAGFATQRLPPHSILRAGFCGAGTFHLWALVDPQTSAGASSEDDAWWVWLRTQGFSQSLTARQPFFSRPSLEIDSRLLPAVAATAGEPPPKRWQLHLPTSTGY